MATLPDVVLNVGEYIEVYAATGIASLTPLMIQNKSRGHVYIQYGDGKPGQLDDDGFIIVELEKFSVPAGNSKVWLRGDGPVAIAADN